MLSDPILSVTMLSDLYQASLCSVQSGIMLSSPVESVIMVNVVAPEKQ